MRSSSIPRSLILVASAALSFGACGESQTDPGGTGAITSPAATTMAGGPAAASAGMTGATATAGKPATPTTSATAGTAGTPASATAGGAGMTATASGTAGGAAATAGSGSAGMSASAAAGASGGSTAAAGTGAASGGATFTMVWETVLTGTGCAVGACHGSAMAPSKLGLADKADAYMQLVGVKAMGNSGPGAMTGGGCAGMDFERVKMGDPDKSLLIIKLENKQTCGMQMPPGGMVKPEQLKLVRDWIMAGAKND